MLRAVAGIFSERQRLFRIVLSEPLSAGLLKGFPELYTSICAGHSRNNIRPAAGKADDQLIKLLAAQAG